MKNLFSTSIGKKFAMAISAIFLMIFLLQHFIINITSVFSEDIFNMLSHFMGTNPLVQFILQPILIAGVLFHFIMGFYLEIQNRKAAKYEYQKEKGFSKIETEGQQGKFDGNHFQNEMESILV